MKIVKYIFLLLLLAAIAITVFIATQEGKYNIKEEKIINVPKSILYNYINDYRNWENLGVLTNADTTAQYTYSQNTAGNGAAMSWIKNGAKGSIQTLNAVAPDSIRQKSIVNDLDSQIVWHFKDTTGGTKVSVSVQGHQTFTEKAYSLINGNTNKDVQSSLANGLENLNVFLVKELKTFNVDVKGVVYKKSTFYLGHSATGAIADINKQASSIFSRLLAFTKENKIGVNGEPFIIYKSINKEQKTASYTYCIPIKDEIFTAAGSEYEGGKLLAFNALKTSLKGDYSHLPKAWNAAHKHIADNALQENTSGQYVEVYSKNIAQSRRPSTWVTDLYVPIGAPQILPEQPEVLNPYIAPRPSGQAGYTAPRATARPATATTPANKPATAIGTGTPAVTKPSTAKPASTTTKPATQKPAGTGAATGTVKPGTGTVKPSTTSGSTKPSTAKPAAAKPATPKPATTPPANVETLELN